MYFRTDRVNPLFNDIRYNSKIRYNVNLVCTTSADRVFFSLIFPCYSSGKKKFLFVYLLESPRRGDSTKYTKRMIHKRVQSIRYSCFGPVHVKLLYNNKFDLTAKFLVTNSVVITRVLCTKSMQDNGTGKIVNIDRMLEYMRL